MATKGGKERLVLSEGCFIRLEWLRKGTESVDESCGIEQVDIVSESSIVERGVESVKGELFLSTEGLFN